MFLNPNIFSNLNSNCSNKLKKHSFTQNCSDGSDLLLFESIILVISKILQVLSAFSLEFIFFSLSLEQFFLTVGQNNFGNKIPKSGSEVICVHGQI